MDMDMGGDGGQIYPEGVGGGYQEATEPWWNCRERCDVTCCDVFVVLSCWRWSWEGIPWHESFDRCYVTMERGNLLVE